MKKFLLAMSAVLVVGQISVAQTAPESVAEVAKQNKTERKAVKVFTEEDLPARSGVTDSNAAAAASIGSDANKGTESTAAHSTGKNGDAKEADTQSKSTPAVAGLKKKLDTYQQERDTWKTSAKRYEAMLANETTDFRREMYQDALDNDKKNVALFQEKIDETQAELAKAQKDDAKHEPGPSSPAPSETQP